MSTSYECLFYPKWIPKSFVPMRYLKICSLCSNVFNSIQVGIAGFVHEPINVSHHSAMFGRAGTITYPKEPKIGVYGTEYYLPPREVLGVISWQLKVDDGDVIILG